MKPSEITRLIENAKLALGRSRTAPDGFLLAYVAWEAFQIRVLIVGLAATGLRVSQATELILESQVWRKQNRDKLFREVYGKSPNNLRYIGKHFAIADRHKELRNAYIHGTQRTSPKNFVKATLELIQIMESDWSSQLKLLLQEEGTYCSHPDPMSRIAPTREKSNNLTQDFEASLLLAKVSFGLETTPRRALYLDFLFGNLKLP